MLPTNAAELSSSYSAKENTIADAADELMRMDRVEKMLSDYELYAQRLTDLRQRTHGLIALTIHYIREFGLPFEKRHEYRRQLREILEGDPRSLEEARANARTAYAEKHGPGLPKTWQNVGAVPNAMS